MGFNYLSIPKLQRLHRWCLGMDKWFHNTRYYECDQFSMLRFKFIHVSKKGPWDQSIVARILEIFKDVAATRGPSPNMN